MTVKFLRSLKLVPLELYGSLFNYEDQVEREENCLNLLRFIVAIQRANSLGGFGKKVKNLGILPVPPKFYVL